MPDTNTPPHQASALAAAMDAAVPEFVLSLNFAHVPKSGGVLDFAENLESAMRTQLGDRLTVVKPRLQEKRHWQVAARFVSELSLELRYWRRPAVALFPNYFICPLPFSKLRRVVVVHDLQFRHYPQYTSRAKRLFLDLCYRIALRRADGMAFISEASRQDFLQIYGAPRLHRAIYNPIRTDSGSGNSAQPTPDPAGGGPYAIANFHFYPHKNVQRLIDCFKALRAAWPELRLVLTGHKPVHFEQMVGGRPEDHGIHHRGFLPKAEVMELVRGAEFFMSLSLFEGFNMSAAEAALYGKPLVLSDIPVHRELFASQALFVPPTGTETPVRAILDFVRGFDRQRAWPFAATVRPDSAAALYIAFMTEAWNHAQGRSP